MRPWFLLFLAGCTGGILDPSEDGDGDGFSIDQGDCDDTDVSIYPGAPETCDGVDSDCDGDDGGPGVDAPTWYEDEDGDGWGDDDTSVVSCEAPAAGWVERGGDCAPDAAAVNPDADEVCNGVDDNCDGSADEGLANLFADADGDGYGDPSAQLDSCEPGEGRADNDQDCDDNDPDLNPDTVWYFDSDGDGWGLDTLTDTGCESPGVDYASQLGDCRPDDPDAYPGAPEICDNGNQPQGIDDNCNGLVDEGCRVVFDCEPITTDTVWSGSMTVPCDVEVGGPLQPTLTIEEGTVVRFGAGNHLRIGGLAAGSLVVQGGETGVRFIADTVSPSAGFWTGVIVDNGSGSQIDNLTISYAGADDASALRLLQDDVTIDGLRITDAAGDGLEVAFTHVDVTDFRAEDVEGDALVCETSATMDVQDAVVRDSGRVFRADLDCAGALRGTLDLNDNVQSLVWVTGLRMSASATWHDLGIPYHLSQGINVAGNADVVTWTVQPGVVVAAEPGQSVQIGAAGRGRLVALGTEAQPITFRSSEPVQSPGDWIGLVFQDASSLSELSHVVVENAGGESVYGASVYMGGENTQVDASHLTVRDGASDGIRVWDGVLALEDSVVMDNAGAGLAVESFGGLGVPVARTVVTGNGVSARFGNANAVGQLSASSTLSGNTDDAVVVTGMAMDTSSTWAALDVPYRVATSLTVAGDTPVDWVLDGTTVEFAAGALLQIGMTSSRTGTLDATDTVFQGVTAAAGSWNGIGIRGSGTLDGCTVRDAGANSSAAIDLFGTATVTGTSVEQAADIGIRCWPGSTVTVSDNTFTRVPTPTSGCD